MLRLLKLIVFLAAVAWSFKYHYGHKPSSAPPGRNLADGQYSAPAAQNQPNLIVYGIQCIQTRKYIGMLDQNGIAYLYKDINQAIHSPQWKQDIEPRMAAANIRPDDIKGPLVDINGQLYVTPDIGTIRAQMDRK